MPVKSIDSEIYFKYGSKEEHSYLYDGGDGWIVFDGKRSVSKGISARNIENLYKFQFQSLNNGVGEFVDFDYKIIEGTQISTFEIWNGNRISQKDWKYYSRIKKARLLVDGVPYAYLNFKDTIDIQFFKVNVPIENKHSIKLRFEILETFKGIKYGNLYVSKMYSHSGL